MKHMQQSAFLYMLFLVIIGLSVSHCTDPEILPLDEGYKPDHKIDFSHELHAKVDCKYCHNPANDGKKEGIPAAKVCMKCHKEEKAKSVK